MWVMFLRSHLLYHSSVTNSCRVLPLAHLWNKAILSVHCIFIDYTDLAMSTITQRQSIAYTGTFPLLRYYLNQLSGDVEEYDVGEKQALRVFKAVNVVFEGRMVTLEVCNSYNCLNLNWQIHVCTVPTICKYFTVVSSTNTDRKSGHVRQVAHLGRPVKHCYLL